LLHWEALFVISTSYSEDVSLELVSQNISIDLLTHFPIKEVASKQAQLASTKKERLTSSFHRQSQFSFKAL